MSTKHNLLVFLLFMILTTTNATEQTSSDRIVAIIGTSNTGLITATRFAQQENTSVIVVEKKQEKINALLAHKCYFNFPEIETLVYKQIDNHKLTFTESISTAVTYNPKFIFICEEPSLLANGTEDLSNFVDAATEIGLNIKNYCVVVNKITAPVGTTDAAKILIQNQLNKRNKEIFFDIAYDAELSYEIESSENFSPQNHIIIGCENKTAEQHLTSLYLPITKNKNALIFMNVKSAELTKYASGAMLATNIEFMNQLTQLANIVDADIEQVKHGIIQNRVQWQKDSHINLEHRKNCILKDTKALIYTTLENKQPLRSLSLINEVNKIDKEQRSTFIKNILHYFGNEISQKNVGIWGLSSAPGTADIYNAPSINIIKKLLKTGATITVYDPAAHENVKALFHKKIRFAKKPDDILKNCDFLIILTGWDEFLGYTPKQFLTLKDKLIFDNHKRFNQFEMAEAGLKYFSGEHKLFMKETPPSTHAKIEKKQKNQSTNPKEQNTEQLTKLLWECLIAHVFEDSIKNISWIKSESFSPRGNAANYSFLYILFRVLNDVKPQSIIEFGIGQTSKMTSQYIAYSDQTNATLTLVEHDMMWINVFKKHIPPCNRIKILQLDLEKREIAKGPKIFHTKTYKELNKNVGEQKFDCIILDGPKGTPHFSRIEILDLLEKNLAKQFVIIIDDYHRKGERETAQRVINKLNDLSIKYETTRYKGITTQLVLYSPCYSFLKSL